MLKSTLPFSKARARCWAGTPVSESYLQGRVRLGRALTRSQGLRSGRRPPPRPAPTSGTAAPGSWQG